MLRHITGALAQIGTMQCVGTSKHRRIGALDWHTVCMHMCQRVGAGAGAGAGAILIQDSKSQRQSSEIPR